MKKNYSNPKFKLVILEPNDIVCESLTGGSEEDGTKQAEGKRQSIWDRE